MIDFGNLRPLLAPRGVPVSGDRLDEFTAALRPGDDSGWVAADPLAGAECHGVGAWALARRGDTPVTVLVRYAHTPDQSARHRELVAAARAEGVDLEDGRPIETVVGRGEDVRVWAAYDGYADVDAAVQDARRLVLESVLARDVAVRSCGWGDACAIVARGLDWSIFRTHADGRIDLSVTQGAMQGIAIYARTVMDLAADLDAALAQTWLYREAAEALSAQAGFQLDRELREAYGSGTPGYSISELARRLHTDRANLSRRISRAKIRSTV